MIRAHLVISEAARSALACAGISTDWLRLWIKSSGAEYVEVHALNDKGWHKAKGWVVVIAEDVDLMRVALVHGKRISADHDGRRTILGSDTFSLINPPRTGWFYRHENSRVILLPVGDIAYQRFVWLGMLNDEQHLLPSLISINENDGESLEPGLFGKVIVNDHERASSRDHASDILNDCGYLPEEQLILLLRKHRLKLFCAESCTAGALAARISHLPGASDILEQGWVTYSNESKMKELGVSSNLLEKHGAVSRQVVEAMARGCIKKGSGNRKAVKRNISCTISGIAGPAGGSDAKPVGTVWIAVCVAGEKPVSKCFHFSGSRTDIQSNAVINAIAMLIGVLT